MPTNTIDLGNNPVGTPPTEEQKTQIREAIDLGSASTANLGTANGEIRTNEQNDSRFIRVAERLGSPFGLWTHLDGVNPPDNSGDFTYIVLSDGQAGVGQYNYKDDSPLIDTVTISGTVPNIKVTARIAQGPLTGQVIPLLNDEGVVLRAETLADSGRRLNDQMQVITGTFRAGRGSSGGDTGAFTRLDLGSANSASGSASDFNYSFNSANSPNARTGDSTRDKSRSIVYYMRIA